MRQTDRKTNRNPDRGIGAGKSALEDAQRDEQKDVPHMPRHWQGSGTRGAAPGQTEPEADQREVARGNQYGEAGEVAARQIQEELTEHGRTPAPQRRDNAQLPKRRGETTDKLPTVDK